MEIEKKAYTMTATYHVTGQPEQTVHFPIVASDKDEAEKKAYWIARANFGNYTLWTWTVDETSK